VRKKRQSRSIKKESGEKKMEQKRGKDSRWELKPDFDSRTVVVVVVVTCACGCL